MTAPAPGQHPVHARTTSASQVRATSFMPRAGSPLGHASLTGTGSGHRLLTEEGGISLEVSCSSALPGRKRLARCCLACLCGMLLM